MFRRNFAAFVMIWSRTASFYAIVSNLYHQELWLLSGIAEAPGLPPHMIRMWQEGAERIRKGAPLQERLS